jgi:preprotein translocase subunit SecG
MWYTIVTILHVLVCFFLATVVLLQQGKGSDVNAVFGGSSQTLFGSSGAGNLLTKLTSASAIVFMLTSLILTYGAARQSTKSLFDNVPASTPIPTTTPEGTSATQSSSAGETSSTTTSPTGAAPSPQTVTSTEGQQSTSTSNASTPATNPAPVPTSPPQPKQPTAPTPNSSTAK